MLYVFLSDNRSFVLTSVQGAYCRIDIKEEEEKRREGGRKRKKERKKEGKKRTEQKRKKKAQLEWDSFLLKR